MVADGVSLAVASDTRRGVTDLGSDAEEGGRMRTAPLPREVSPDSVDRDPS